MHKISLVVAATLPLSLISLNIGAAGNSISVAALGRGCNEATLRGTYLYKASGIFRGVSLGEIGKEVFDGAGNIKVTWSDKDNSKADQNGTYTLGRHCIGVSAYQQPSGSYSYYDIYTEPSGRTIRSIRNSENADMLEGDYIIGESNRTLR